MKPTTAIVLLVTALLYIGCEQQSQTSIPDTSTSTPAETPVAMGSRDTLAAYLNGTKGDDDAGYKYISSKDQAAKSLESYMQEYNNPISKGFASKVDYKIINIQEQGDDATATVEITMPDIHSLVGDAMAAAFKGKDSAQLKDDMGAKLNSDTIPLKTETKGYQMLRENGEWRIVTGWANELAKKQEEQRDKDEYLNKVEIYDISAKYHETYRDDKVPGVNFKLKNTGDRTLKRVEVTVYFMDENGNTISEENFNPVLVSRFSSSSKPLRPGYIWQQEQGRFYKADSVPSEWKEGAVTAKVTDIKFIQEDN